MNALAPLLRRRRFVMEVEPGIRAIPDLEDRVVWWCFVDGCRSWDPVFELSQSLVRPGDTIVDVGAHVGFWIMSAARRAMPGGRAVAFEPTPHNLLRLRRNLALNALDYVRCEPMALADQEGPSDFFVADNGNEGLGSLASHDDANRRITVTTTTLDAWCASNNVTTVDVLKIDVEGAEQRVLTGARAMLAPRRRPVILFEADDSRAAPFPGGVGAVKRLLREHGYRVYRYDGVSLAEVGLTEPHAGEDLLGLSPDHFERHAPLRAALGPSPAR